jgi:hypothetical protein
MRGRMIEALVSSLRRCLLQGAARKQQADIVTQ